MGLFSRTPRTPKITNEEILSKVIEETDNEDTEIEEIGTYQLTEEDISINYINKNILSEDNKEVLNVMDIDNIPSYKYQYMDNVKIINILNYINSIGNDAFKECENVTTINFTAPIKGLCLGNNTFANCNKLESINFNGSFSVIGDNCFAHCNNLKSINLSGVDTIPINAFMFNTNLSNVIITNAQYIKSGAFMYCKSLENIKFKSCYNLLDIEAYSFSNCNLHTVTIPPTVRFIDGYAFEDNFNLTDVYFEHSVNAKIELGDNIFNHCDNVIIHTNNKCIIDYCKQNRLNIDTN